MQVGSQGKIQSAINVTPLVDVALVLLIVYMIITAMIRQGIQVDLPVADYAQKKTENLDKLTTITIDENKDVYINVKKVEKNTPPTTTRPKGILDSPPAPRPMAIGSTPKIVENDVSQPVRRAR